jgi:hypothetical protein
MANAGVWRSERIVHLRVWQCKGHTSHLVLSGEDQGPVSCPWDGAMDFELVGMVELKWASMEEAKRPVDEGASNA